MHQHPLTAQAAALARWCGRRVLLGAVIVGVLAMHVLSGPEGFHGHSMPAGMAMSAEIAGARDVPVMPGMATADPRVDMRLPALQPAARAVVANMVSPAPTDRSGMACCTLFLLTGAGGLLLALLLRAIRRQADVRLGSEVPQLLWQQRRGPPTIPAPRTLLCVLRV